MKIAMIGQKGIPAIFGGVERHVEELSARLVRMGVDVAVYCRRWYSKDEQSVHGIRKVFVPTIHSKHLDAIVHTFFATLHALFVEKPDVIHYHGVGPALLAWIPRFFAPRTRVVITFHSTDRTHDKWGGFARLMLRMGEWSACKNADRTIVVSKQLQNYCAESYDAVTDYLPNGVTEFPTPSGASLAEWNLIPGRYILFVGRIIRLKGLHTLIAAYRNLPEKIRAMYPLVITGTGVFSNQYLRELTTLSRGLTVKFVGNQQGTALASLFAHATMLVHPSETESMPIVVLEAAGMGLPIIASDIAAHREILGKNGIFFESKNILELARAISETLSHIDKAKAKAEMFSEIVKDAYSWNRIARATKDVYLETAPIKDPILVTEA